MPRVDPGVDGDGCIYNFSPNVDKGSEPRRSRAPKRTRRILELGLVDMTPSNPTDIAIGFHRGLTRRVPNRR